MRRAELPKAGKLNATAESQKPKGPKHLDENINLPDSLT